VDGELSEMHESLIFAF